MLRERKKDSLSEPQPLHEYMVTVEGEGHATEKRRFAENLHNMALLYVDLRRYAEAEEYDLRALEIRESIFGHLHPEVALSLHSLGRVYTFQKRYPEADQRFKEALRIFEVTLGELHPHVARCWEGLAEMSRLAQHTGDAEYAAVRAREIRTALAAASPPQ